MRRAVLLLALGLASCATYDTFVPPAGPILKTDKVKTEADAIRIGMNCGLERGDPAHWEAELHADLWHVYWANGQNTIKVQVAKKDGAVLSCDVDDDDTEPGK
ncbi:MAG TPA: hypothetical protein VFV07_05135 [Rhizomicrobium sp.]|nr:hypothetical protein [Rhizomicrobium sp.]